MIKSSIVSINEKLYFYDGQKQGWAWESAIEFYIN